MRKVTAALLLVVVASSFATATAQDAGPASLADFKALVSPTVLASALDFATAGPIGATWKSLTSPASALAVTDAITSKFGMGLKLATGVGALATAVHAGGAFALAAADANANALQQAVTDILDTDAKIMNELSKVARDAVVAKAFAPYRQASASIKLMSELVKGLTGPGGLFQAKGTLIKALADPVVGIPGMVGQAANAAALLLTNPASAAANLAKGVATAVGKVKGVVVSAANLVPKPNVRGAAAAVLQWLKGAAGKWALGLGPKAPLGSGALGGVVRSVLTAWLSPVKLLLGPGPVGFGLFRDALGAAGVDTSVPAAVVAGP